MAKLEKQNIIEEEKMAKQELRKEKGKQKYKKNMYTLLFNERHDIFLKLESLFDYLGKLIINLGNEKKHLTKSDYQYYGNINIIYGMMSAVLQELVYTFRQNIDTAVKYDFKLYPYEGDDTLLKAEIAYYKFERYCDEIYVYLHYMEDSIKKIESIEYINYIELMHKALTPIQNQLKALVDLAVSCLIEYYKPVNEDEFDEFSCN